jgi:hypothetical protein
MAWHGGTLTKTIGWFAVDPRNIKLGIATNGFNRMDR